MGSWARAPGFPGRTPSTASHGDAVEIFINDTLALALAHTVARQARLYFAGLHAYQGRAQHLQELSLAQAHDKC